MHAQNAVSGGSSDRLGLRTIYGFKTFSQLLSGLLHANQVIIYMVLLFKAGEELKCCKVSRIRSTSLNTSTKRTNQA